MFLMKKFYLEKPTIKRKEDALKELLANGAGRAREYASKKMDIVKEKIGLKI
jgi:hypothetical protein